MQNAECMKTKCLNLEPGGPFTAAPRPDIVMHHCVATQIELYVPDRDSYVQLHSKLNAVIAS